MIEEYRTFRFSLEFGEKEYFVKGSLYVKEGNYFEPEEYDLQYEVYNEQGEIVTQEMLEQEEIDWLALEEIVKSNL